MNVTEKLNSYTHKGFEVTVGYRHNNWHVTLWYGEKRSDPGTLSGYGEAATLDEAVEKAERDLKQPMGFE